METTVIGHTGYLCIRGRHMRMYMYVYIYIQSIYVSVRILFTFTYMLYICTDRYSAPVSELR